MKRTCLITVFMSLSAIAQPNTMKHNATGTFDVKLDVQKPDNKSSEAAKIGRMSIDKHFHGDLTGTSQGEMLSMMTEVKGSGVYVAVERVNATLGGKTGTFALHHTGIMIRDTPHLNVTVVPDSGTGELTGIAGTLNIKIEGGKHFYDFEYTLP